MVVVRRPFLYQGATNLPCASNHEMDKKLRGVCGVRRCLWGREKKGGLSFVSGGIFAINRRFSPPSSPLSGKIIRAGKMEREKRSKYLWQGVPHSQCFPSSAKVGHTKPGWFSGLCPLSNSAASVEIYRIRGFLRKVAPISHDRPNLRIFQPLTN